MRTDPKLNTLSFWTPLPNTLGDETRCPSGENSFPWAAIPLDATTVEFS
jgi:hypothetical protein